MDEIYYCGFNGFKQVPSQPEKHTITSLVLQTPPIPKSGRTIIDVAICWVSTEFRQVHCFWITFEHFLGQTFIGLQP